MIIESTHHESWHVTIHREKSDEGWPDVMPASWDHHTIRPERIICNLNRSSGVSGSVGGPKLKKDGTPGAVSAHENFYGWPDGWLGQKIRKAREDLGLTPEATGVNW